MHKNHKKGHNKNIQLTKKLDKEILILPLSIPPLYEAVEWGIFAYVGARFHIWLPLLYQLMKILLLKVDIQRKKDVL